MQSDKAVPITEQTLQDFQGEKLNPVPVVNIASVQDVALDATEHLKELEPITDLDRLALHVAQLTATVAEHQKLINCLANLVADLSLENWNKVMNAKGMPR